MQWNVAWNKQRQHNIEVIWAFWWIWIVPIQLVCHILLIHRCSSLIYLIYKYIMIIWSLYLFIYLRPQISHTSIKLYPFSSIQSFNHSDLLCYIFPSRFFWVAYSRLSNGLKHSTNKYYHSFSRDTIGAI